MPIMVNVIISKLFIGNDSMNLKPRFSVGFKPKLNGFK